MFKRVLEKGKIGSVEINNRFIMPAMGSSHGESDGKVGERLIEYYSARARGGFGLIITEFTCIDPVGKAIPGQLMINSDEYIEGFKKLTDRIHKEGSKIFMQLHHAGRQTCSYITGMRPVAPSPIPCPVNRELPKELSTEEVYKLIEKFGDGALRAKKAGFDGVEIHGAHGYIVAQFLSSYSNKRTDEFGLDIKGRAKFACEIIKNIKEKCGQDFPVIFRISGEERVFSGRKIEESAILSKEIEKSGADAIHVSTGVYASMPYIIAPANMPNGFFVKDAEVIKKSVNIPVIAVGRITEPLMAEEIISFGSADFVALGRASIADPEFPRKVKEGRIKEISPCVGCLTRCNGAQGIDPKDRGVSCMLNPLSGHEDSLKIVKTENPKNIVVVGGGPAGLEVAWISAARGHKVTLFEKENKLGGQIIPGSIPPSKHELTRGINYYTEMCKKYGVDIKLGTEADKEKILVLNPDEVIIATGAKPFNPNIQNEGIPVVQAIDALNGKVMLGNNILIVGGGLVGLETAEYLLTLNKKATVVEMMDKAGDGLNKSVQYFIFNTLKEAGVNIYTNTKVESFTKDGAICKKDNEEINFSGYDMVILAIGSKSYNPLKELKEHIKNIHLIGDVVKPRRIIDAVEEAARLAITI